MEHLEGVETAASQFTCQQNSGKRDRKMAPAGKTEMLQSHFAHSGNTATLFHP